MMQYFLLQQDTVIIARIFIPVMEHLSRNKWARKYLSAAVTTLHSDSIQKMTAQCYLVYKSHP